MTLTSYQIFCYFGASKRLHPSRLFHRNSFTNLCLGTSIQISESLFVISDKYVQCCIVDAIPSKVLLIDKNFAERENEKKRILQRGRMRKKINTVYLQNSKCVTSYCNSYGRLRRISHDFLVHSCSIVFVS